MLFSSSNTLKNIYLFLLFQLSHLRYSNKCFHLLSTYRHPAKYFKYFRSHPHSGPADITSFAGKKRVEDKFSFFVFLFFFSALKSKTNKQKNHCSVGKRKNISPLATFFTLSVTGWFFSPTRSKNLRFRVFNSWIYKRHLENSKNNKNIKLLISKLIQE